MDNIEFIRNTGRVLKAFINKYPFEECIKETDSLLSMELNSNQKTACQNMLDFIIKTFADADTYPEIKARFDSFGTNPTSFCEINNCYMFSKYFSGDMEAKEFAEEFLTKIQLTYNHYAYSFYMLLIFMTENINIIKHFKYYADSYNDHIYLYIIEKNTKMIEVLLKAGYTLDTDLILKIAVFHPEIYREYLSKHFFKNLPIIFRKNNKVLRDIPELISFLFKSSRYHTYLLDNNIFFHDSLDIIIHLFKLLNTEGFERIKEYCPSISILHCSTASSLINEDNSIIENIKTKIDDNLVLYGMCQSMLGNYMFNEVKKIKNLFADKSISITYGFLKNFYSPSNVLSVIKMFKGKVISFPTEPDDYYCNVVSFNDKALTEKAVECGIINSVCYEDTIEYAVERNAYNVLDVLRAKYNDIFPKDTIEWGTFAPDSDN